MRNIAIFGHESLSKKPIHVKQLQVRMETGGLCAACGTG